MYIPTPNELLREFQKIDPTLFMVSIPSLGVVSYGSPLHHYGFVVGIDPESGNLSCIVGNANIFTQNETSEFMPIADCMQWFRERFDIWREIPVQGRTTSRREAEENEEPDDDGSSELEVTPLVQSVIDDSSKNIIDLTVGK